MRSDDMRDKRRRRSILRKKPLLNDLQAHWESHIHFSTFKIQTFGNWIPRLLSRWYCNGHGCGLDQIALVDGSGKCQKSQATIGILSNEDRKEQ